MADTFELWSSFGCRSTRHFLIRQYRTQMKRRAQQIQEELVNVLYLEFADSNMFHFALF